jgi:DNA-binding response OmpR family regulator
MASLLVIEDDGAIRRGLHDALTHAGHDVQAVADGEEGLARAVQGSVDLVILDRVLPGMDGMAVLAGVRAALPTLPVILFTAVASERDRVAGLTHGADDYVVKPFALSELLARIEAVLRRSPQRPTDVAEVRVPGAVVDVARREVRFADGERVPLAEREAALLRYLALHRARAVPREELLAQVWRVAPGAESGAGGSRAVDMHIARLREKLRDAGDRPRILLTVRGAGYTLAMER